MRRGTLLPAALADLVVDGTDSGSALHWLADKMPFKKEGNSYRSSSGRKFTKKQVAMYYATHGFRKKSAYKKHKSKS